MHCFSALSMSYFLMHSGPSSHRIIPCVPRHAIMRFSACMTQVLAAQIRFGFRPVPVVAINQVDGVEAATVSQELVLQCGRSDEQSAVPCRMIPKNN
jgi:hypothetical protein